MTAVISTIDISRTRSANTMLELFDRYRNEFLPLIVPVTLLNHYVRKIDEPYLKQQVYLNPHPVALKRGLSTSLGGKPR